MDPQAWLQPRWLQWTIIHFFFLFFCFGFLQGKERGVGGDLRGDGFQNGGLLVVGKGGKVLYSFVQENPADHAANEDILKVSFAYFVFCAVGEEWRKWKRGGVQRVGGKESLVIFDLRVKEKKGS